MADRDSLGRFYKGMKGAHTSHGLTKSHFGRKYHLAKDRCINPKTKAYVRYGGKGIKFLWSSLEEFRDDMYESYQAHVAIHGQRNTTIDRIDVNGPYSKENCRWATWKQQANNKTNRVFLEYNGVRKTAAEWQVETGVPANKILDRVRRGWSLQKIFSQPNLKLYEYQGKNQSLADWARESGMPYGKLWDRVVKEGWPLQKALQNKDFRL